MLVAFFYWHGVYMDENIRRNKANIYAEYSDSTLIIELTDGMHDHEETMMLIAEGITRLLIRNPPELIEKEWPSGNKERG